MIYTILFLCTVIYLLNKYFTRNFDYWKNRNTKYIEPLPIFGNYLEVLLLRNGIGQYLAKLYNSTDEPYFGIFVFNRPVLILRSPEIIKNVLVKDFDHFTDRSVSTCEHEPIFNNFLFFSKSPKWKSNRKMASPVFSSGKLKSMYPSMKNVAEDMNAYINNKTSLNAKDVCSKYSTEVITKCALGIKANSFENENAEFMNIGKICFGFSLRNAFSQISYFFLPSFVKFFKLLFVPIEALKFMQNVFLEILNARENGPSTGVSLVDSVIELKEKGKFKNEEEYRSMSFSFFGQFFFAGFETTSSTMAFTLYELCINSDLQDKVRKEIKSCVEKYNGFTYEAVYEMTFLEMCVKETLRKYPVLPFLDRECNLEYKVPGTDTVIEKGTAIYIPMFGLHYDEKYFSDADKYIPERFSEENIENITPFTYFPFGEGPRFCIGARFGLLGAKLGLAHILSEFKVKKNSETPMPLVYEPKSFVLASKVGLPMDFIKIRVSQY